MKITLHVQSRWIQFSFSCWWILYFNKICISSSFSSNYNALCIPKHDVYIENNVEQIKKRWYNLTINHFAITLPQTPRWFFFSFFFNVCPSIIIFYLIGEIFFTYIFDDGYESSILFFFCCKILGIEILKTEKNKNNTKVSI